MMKIQMLSAQNLNVNPLPWLGANRIRLFALYLIKMMTKISKSGWQSLLFCDLEKWRLFTHPPFCFLSAQNTSRLYLIFRSLPLTSSSFKCNVLCENSHYFPSWPKFWFYATRATMKINVDIHQFYVTFWNDLNSNFEFLGNERKILPRDGKYPSRLYKNNNNDIQQYF